MSKLHRFFSVLFVLLVTSYLSPLSAYAQSAWSGRCVSSAHPDVATIQGVECLFFNILQIIVFIAGMAFFVMFLNGGFQYLLSSGDPKKIAQSGSTLTMAIIGIVGIIGSWFIIKFLQEFTGTNLTNFYIPS